MGVTFSPGALRNIAEIVAFIATENPSAAEKVRRRIEAVTAFLGEYPSAGRPTGLRNVRVCPVGPYPYLVFFAPVPGRSDVRILRVRHAARRPLHLSGASLNDPGQEFHR